MSIFFCSMTLKKRYLRELDKFQFCSMAHSLNRREYLRDTENSLLQFAMSLFLLQKRGFGILSRKLEHHHSTKNKITQLIRCLIRDPESYYFANGHIYHMCELSQLVKVFKLQFKEYNSQTIFFSFLCDHLVGGLAILFIHRGGR